MARAPKVQDAVGLTITGVNGLTIRIPTVARRTLDAREVRQNCAILQEKSNLPR
jgi:hypothetical protein